MFEVSLVNLLLSLLLFSSLVTLYMLGFISKIKSFTIAFYAMLIRFVLSIVIAYIILSYEYLSELSNDFLNDNHFLSIVIFSSLLLINLIAFMKLPKLIGKTTAKYITNSMFGNIMKTESDSSENRNEFYSAFDGLSSFIKKDFITSIFILFIVGIIGYFLGLYQYSLYVNFIILFAIFTQLAILLVNLSYVIALIKCIYNDFIIS